MAANKRKRRLSMHRIHEILRLYLKFDLKVRHIARACKISTSTAHNYVEKIKLSQLTWEDAQKMSVEELQKLLCPEPERKDNQKPMPDFAYLDKEMKKKGVTLQLLWEEYIANNPNGYCRSQFCHLYRKEKKKLHPVMRQNHKAGEKVFVDFSGDKPCYFDPKTGEKIEVELFVAAMGASSYTFAHAVPDQKSENWIRCHMKTFEFFGCCPTIVVPDNLKSGVTSACYYDPDINKAYQDMAEYYDVVVLPARKYKARDKAKVESAVLNAQRRILAVLRNRKFFSLAELNQAIRKETENLNNRKMQIINKSRKELFEEIDKPAMRPLPIAPYRTSTWKKVTVQLDYHVEVNGKYYSVPYTLIRKEVDVKYNSETVEIFLCRKRITTHCIDRSEKQNITTPFHMPHEHRNYLEWTPDKIRKQASLIGENTAMIIEAIMARTRVPEAAFRMSLGILRLSKSYSPERLEAACRKACSVKVYKYSFIKAMLQNKMENAEYKNSQAQVIYHENLRGENYYKELNNEH